jgi:hypothetical protein
MGDLHQPGLMTGGEKKFAYVRYNRVFDPAHVGRTAGGRRVRFTLDNLELIPFLQEAGRQYAEQHVTAAHLLPDTAARGTAATSSA